MPRFTASSYLMYFFFGWYPIIHTWLVKTWSRMDSKSHEWLDLNSYATLYGEYLYNIQKERVFLVESHLV